MPKINKQIAVDFTRRRLWAHGYSVKTLSKSELGFDLIVDGDKRVLVIPGAPSGLQGLFDACDLVAYVVRDKFSGQNGVYFAVPGSEKLVTNPKEVLIKEVK